MTRRSFGGDDPHLVTGTPVSAGDIAFAFRTSIFVLAQGPGSPEWKQMMSDTTGANALMMLGHPGRRGHGVVVGEGRGERARHAAGSLTSDPAGGHRSG